MKKKISDARNKTIESTTSRSNNVSEVNNEFKDKKQTLIFENEEKLNRSKEDIEAGKTANFVNNRTLARLFCYATEWQLPAEGLFTLFNYIISIVHNNKLDFSNGRFVVNVRFNNKGRSKRTISSKA